MATISQASRPFSQHGTFGGNRDHHRSYYEDDHFSDSEDLPSISKEGVHEDFGGDNTTSGGSTDAQTAHSRALEARLEKRKMKRFRLTHNQTRYLMSEFARQAHPDAAQRERLSREIPGLSPRQVQVWFQNRRAKLKRMSSDDRDRMMRSRALPEEFPILHTLHPYSPSQQGSRIQIPHHVRSPIIGQLQGHMNDDFISPIETRSTFPPYGFHSPTTSGEIISPTSTTYEKPVAYVTASNMFPRGNPFSVAPGNDAYQHHMKSAPFQGIPRTIPENSDPSGQSNTSYNNGRMNEENDYQQQASTPTSNSRFTYPSYPTPQRTSFLTSAGHMNYKTSIPITSQTANHPGYSPMSMVSSSHMPQQLSAPADATTFSTSYLTMGTPTNSTYSPASSIYGDNRNERMAQFGRSHGHRSRRSSSHPPDFSHMSSPHQ